MKNNVVIIDYGASNVLSVQFALERLGVTARLTSKPTEIRAADKVLFPGVGEAGSAMMEIKKYGLDKIIPELDQPVLGICLGMQLLCNITDEGDTNCLNVFPLKVKRFKTGLKVPHTGWNEITSLNSPLFRGIDQGSHVYFVHSYYVEASGFTIAEATYDLTFPAAIQKDNFYGCQFHPEKSGGNGEQILTNFLSL